MRTVGVMLSKAVRARSLGLVMLTGSLGLAAAADDVPKSSRGQQLYNEHACYACHGYRGQTGARDLVGTGSPLVANEELFIAFLRGRSDVAPVLPSTRMPNYSAGTLSDAEAREILTYIRTFALDTPQAKDVPTLKAILDLAQERAR